jgi:tetratricopeptide (TPR) repeat protein
MPPFDFDTLWDYDHPERTEAVFRQLLLKEEPNTDPSYHLQLLTQLARTQALQRHFTEADATLDQVQPHLTADLVQATTRYRLERGRVLNSSGHPQDARAWFQQAWELAQEHREDFYAIDALHMLAIVAPPAEQSNWNTLALQTAEASTDERARNWRGSLYNNMGWTAHDLGDYERALDLFQKAVQCREEQGKLREILIARWCVGRVLRSLQRYQEALAIQEELYKEWASSQEEQDGYGAEEIAECLLALGRASESRPYFTQAYTLLSQDIWLVAQEPERLQRLKQLGKSQNNKSNKTEIHP